MKGIIIMAEFGENLKKVREERGLTQQSLAEQLFVTRQAVSRWEGGSRYPDLMTAKKMSQLLGVSLDELLSDDDMKKYVERNAILDSSIAKRVQIVLIALALMCSLVLSVFYLSNFMFSSSLAMLSESELIKNVLLTIVLGYGTYEAISDKLNSKVATIISVLYFGMAILTGVIYGAFFESGITGGVLLGAAFINVVILVICVRFFSAKKKTSPVPLYIVTGIYALIGVINSVMGLTSDIPSELYREYILLNVCSLIEVLLLLTLLVFMAYVLNNKRKLAMK